MIRICENWLPLYKFKLCRCFLWRFQVDCYNTLLTICDWNWYKICFLLVYLGSSLIVFIPFPPEMNQFIDLTRLTRLLIFSCFLYIDQGRHSCPGASCDAINKAFWSGTLKKFVALLPTNIVPLQRVIETTEIPYNQTKQRPVTQVNNKEESLSCASVHLHLWVPSFLSYCTSNKKT